EEPDLEGTGRAAEDAGTARRQGRFLVGLHTERGRAMSDELPERLRAAAEEFEPDGERMWDRVVSGMTEPSSVRAEPVRRRSRLPHLAVATAAVVVLIGAIVFAGYVLGPVSDGTAPAGPATS